MTSKRHCHYNSNRKNRKAKNNNTSVLQKPMPRSCFIKMKVVEEESTELEELPATLVNVALLIRTSCAASRISALDEKDDNLFSWTSISD
jgi:hypothetical protein